LELNIFLNNYLNRKIKVFPGEDTAGAGQGETLPIPFQQRLTILLELELNIFLNNYLNRKIKVFPGEDTAGAGQGETRTIQTLLTK